MHIVLGVLGVLGMIAYFVIRANQVNRASRDLAQTAGDVKRFVRRSRWQSRTHVDSLRQIDDPRLGAAVMMVAIAKSDGDVTERQRDAILDRMSEILRLTALEAQEVYGEARWLLQDLNDTATILRRAAPTIRVSCSEDEIDELIAMIESIARVEGPMTDLQRNAIDGLKRKLRPGG